MKIKEFIKEIIDEPSKLDELDEEEYSKLIKYLQKSYFNKNISFNMYFLTVSNLIFAQFLVSIFKLILLIKKALKKYFDKYIKN